MYESKDRWANGFSDVQPKQNMKKPGFKFTSSKNGNKVTVNCDSMTDDMYLRLVSIDPALSCFLPDDEDLLIKCATVVIENDPYYIKRLGDSQTEEHVKLALKSLRGLSYASCVSLESMYDLIQCITIEITESLYELIVDFCPDYICRIPHDKITDNMRHIAISNKPECISLIPGATYDDWLSAIKVNSNILHNIHDEALLNPEWLPLLIYDAIKIDYTNVCMINNPSESTIIHAIDVSEGDCMYHLQPKYKSAKIMRYAMSNYTRNCIYSMSTSDYTYELAIIAVCTNDKFWDNIPVMYRTNALRRLCKIDVFSLIARDGIWCAIDTLLRVAEDDEITDNVKALFKKR